MVEKESDMKLTLRMAEREKQSLHLTRNHGEGFSGSNLSQTQSQFLSESGCFLSNRSQYRYSIFLSGLLLVPRFNPTYYTLTRNAPWTLSILFPTVLECQASSTILAIEGEELTVWESLAKVEALIS